MSYECTVEVPRRFCDALTATMSVDLFELPSHEPTTVINRDQKYLVEVCVELGAAIKKLLCGKWCVSVAAEGVGPASEKKMTKIIPMNNCDPKPDCVTFDLPGEWFEGGGGVCGDVYYLVVTVVALDSCEDKPIGIAGYCKIGPVMVYG